MLRSRGEEALEAFQFISTTNNQTSSSLWKVILYQFYTYQLLESQMGNQNKKYLENLATQTPMITQKVEIIKTDRDGIK